MTTIADTDPIETIEHVWSDAERCAVEAALAADRPLLLAGEPGVGKTELAWAAAKQLNRALVPFTVDSQTESRDLLYHFDAVQRLAEAQVISSLYNNDSKRDESMRDAIRDQMREEIAVRKFVHPGPLWWAIDWVSAAKTKPNGHGVPTKVDGSPGTEKNGVVVLIDEIDKAESDVPNGLLEAFAMRQFTPPGWDKPVVAAKDNVKRPLVIVTTNRERVLPDPFLRRCFVLNLELPAETETQAFTNYLIERGTVHFRKRGPELLGSEDAFEKLLAKAAQQLLEDRIEAKKNQSRPWPGVAEYLDLLRAILQLTSEGKDPEKVYAEITSFGFAYCKSTGADA